MLTKVGEEEEEKRRRRDGSPKASDLNWESMGFIRDF
jgi:hypothetical protein